MPRRSMLEARAATCVSLERSRCQFGVATPWAKSAQGRLAGSGRAWPPRRVRRGRPLAVARARGIRFTRRARLADTLRVRFWLAALRVRTRCARTRPTSWLLPPALLEQPSARYYEALCATPCSTRRLVAAASAPTCRPRLLPARHALRRDLAPRPRSRRSARRAERGLASGGGPFEFPRFDVDEMRGWFRARQLGASFHVVLAYAPTARARTAPAGASRGSTPDAPLLFAVASHARRRAARQAVARCWAARRRIAGIVSRARTGGRLVMPCERAGDREFDRPDRPDRCGVRWTRSTGSPPRSRSPCCVAVGRAEHRRNARFHPSVWSGWSSERD